MVVNPYLIALDLDGTLLTSNKTIDRQTAAYLRKLSKQHVIVLATGRPFRSAKKYYDQLQLTTPIVCYNGAFVTHPHDPSFPERAFAFPQHIVKAIATDVGDAMIDNIMCETNDTIWLLKEESGLEDFFWHKGMHMVYGPLQQTLTTHPMTMIMKSRQRDDQSDKVIVDAVQKHPGLSIRFWGDSPYSEIYFDELSKGSALMSLLEHLHIPQDRWIAFGDAENDREMLTLAPHSYAMMNAIDSIKKTAKYVTRFDNNHHAIKETLQTFFNQLID
jgi:5-amino-6-(5-phospho-D-ribitylamino)uracil phosphatase